MEIQSNNQRRVEVGFLGIVVFVGRKNTWHRVSLASERDTGQPEPVPISHLCITVTITPSIISTFPDNLVTNTSQNSVELKDWCWQGHPPLINKCMAILLTHPLDTLWVRDEHWSASVSILIRGCSIRHDELVHLKSCDKKAYTEGAAV